MMFSLSSFEDRDAHAWCGRLVALVALVAAIGCGGPATTDVEGPPEGSFTADPSAFVRDELAVAASWYDYDGNTHILTPRAETYVVREATEEGERFAAVRIDSYYDPETSASGVFSLTLATWDDDAGAWGADRAWRSPKDIRYDGAACLDVFEGADRDCDQLDWQLQLRVFPMLIPEAGLVVGNPGLFLRSIAGHPEHDTLRIATVPANAMNETPAPMTLPMLSDGSPSTWADLTWDRTQLSPNLPRRGMAVGPALNTDADTPDIMFMLTPLQDIVRFTAVADATDAPSQIAFTVSVAAFDAPSATWAPFDEQREATVEVPTDGQVTYLKLSEPDLRAFDADEDITRQLAPPFENTWDAALEHVDGEVRFVLSPSSALFNHTAAGGDDVAFDAALPPQL